jgi:hypothetical protein
MPRKTLKERREQLPTDDNENRVRGVVRELNGVENSDDKMEALISVLSESGVIPSAGKVYTFFYTAKTNGIRYDEFPLVLVADVYSWGFRGENFHWGGEMRKYNYNQVVGQLYEIYPEEISDVIELSFRKIRSK